MTMAERLPIKRQRNLLCGALAKTAWWIVVLSLWTISVEAFATTSSSSPPAQPASSTSRRTPIPSCPPISPATGLENRFYEWKHGQRIRYQRTPHKKAVNAAPVLLIHGLFVNSDHWRHTLRGLDEAGYNAYALDLFGCGYSDKPPAASPVAQLCNGENARFLDDSNNNKLPSILRNVSLGRSSGGPQNRVVDIELRHPLGSPYNFYTWADQIADFCRDVILPDNPQQQKVSLVCNSIGTISSFQAVLDHPDLFQGVFVVSPNFRELHSAEVPFAPVTMPLVRTVQALLRERGQGLFDALANPATVQTILQVPYHVDEAVDDTLVQVLLDPLLTPGASQVVFDLLSYSAGPLPEQQLQQFSSSSSSSDPNNIPVWVVYGTQDPWTPGPRVEALQLCSTGVVERVVALPNVGHCPHDERPDLVNPLLVEFLQRLERPSQES